MATLRDIMKQFIKGEGVITSAMPTLMGSSPGNAFKDSPATMTIVKGYQVALNRLGAKVPVTGVMDPRTAWAARQVSGDAWTTHKWASLYDDVSQAIYLGKKLQAAPGGNTAMGYLGAGDMVSDALAAKPLPVVGSVVPISQMTVVSQAKAYAAAAFNVSIGKAKSSSDAARWAWARAAEAYAMVHTMLIPGVMSLASAKTYLQNADKLANVASKTSGAAAPSPGIPSATPPAFEPQPGGMLSMAGLPSWLLPVALAGGAALLLFGKKKRR